MPPSPADSQPGRTSPEAGEKWARFDQLVADVTDYAIFRLDRNGNILNWNRGAELVKFYRAEEIIGRHFSCFYSEEDRASGWPTRELEIASLEGRFTDEGWRYRKDGSAFWANVTITAIRADDGTVEGFFKITRDLTERQMATEALRQSEERFRLLLESVQDYAIFMLDPEGHVISWNSGARRIKGYEESEVLGRHFSMFYPPEALAAHTPETLIRQALASGSAEHEGWRVRKDGTRFWGNVVISPLRNAAGELQGFAKVTRDLTERRNIEHLLESGRRKDAFLATLAHELRNPLAPILPGVDLLMRMPGNAAIVTDVAAMLKRQVHQMARLIEDLLDMSRITTGKIVLRKVRHPLQEVVDSAVETVRPAIDALGHELVIDVPARPVEIEADPHRLSQIISNLLSNAAKYTPPGGRISLEATVSASSLLILSVTDNGKGIIPGLQETIFELFDQGIGGSPDGLGIGLTLVKSLAELHGGSVTVESAGEDRGSRFTLFLPVVVAGAEDRPEADGLRSVAGERPVRVLVADDSRNAADILAMFFNVDGMETAVAYDGVEAVETAMEFQPDLACLDLGMPRMDGFEAARRIRKIHPRVHLVALSGWGSEDDRRRTREAGFDFHLVKPVKPDDLREVLAGLLGT